MKECPHCPWGGGGGKGGERIPCKWSSNECKDILVYTKNFFSWLKNTSYTNFLIDDKLLSDFKEKANRFNKFFSCQSTLLNNGSEFPSRPTFVTNERLSSDEDIIKIIRALNINKAHSHDDISIRMIKMCDYLGQ